MELPLIALLMDAAQQSPAIRRPRAALRVVLAGVVAAGAVFAWPRIADWQQRRFAEELAERAMRSAETSPQSVRQMWQLGQPATEPLVQLAAMQRPEVARAAQDALSDQLTAWEIEFENRGDERSLGERLAALSAALERHAGRFDATGQRWAKKLARQIVARCEQLPADDAWTVLAACERVLSAPTLALPASERVEVIGVSAPPLGAAKTQAVAPPITAVEADLPAVSPVEVLAAARSASLGELSVIMPPTEPLPARPRAVIGVTPSNPLRPEENDADGRAEADGFAAALEGIAANEPSAVDVPSPLDMRRSKQRLRDLSDQKLIGLADSAPRFEAAAARSVLRGRGYSDELLETTRELRKLPAAERRQALERAGSLPAAEARRLLRWFVADEDAEVRLHALTMLATTGDPQLAEIARERAVDDADPRVAELATKLLQSR